MPKWEAKRLGPSFKKQMKDVRYHPTPQLRGAIFADARRAIAELGEALMAEHGSFESDELAIREFGKAVCDFLPNPGHHVNEVVVALTRLRMTTTRARNGACPDGKELSHSDYKKDIGPRLRHLDIVLAEAIFSQPPGSFGDQDKPISKGK